MLSAKITAIEEHRKQCAGIPHGVAPRVLSSSFRAPPCTSLTRANKFDHRLTEEARKRQGATLKGSASAASTLRLTNLGNARPTPALFPWQAVSLDAVSTPGMENNLLHSRPTSTRTCRKGEDAYDLGIALNYGYSAGSPQLLRFVTEHVELIHQPPYADYECCLTSGSTSALEVLLRMLCNRGDSILTEAYTYADFLESAGPLGVNVVGIDMDDCGLIPASLDATLCNWNISQGPKPFVLYTIPSGQNPTGTTQSAERRKAIYEVAQSHDLIILEDDPYYFLRLNMTGNAPSIDDYLASLPKSYLSMDTAGRVLRLDSTSKILAPGLRCGWLTGSAELIAKFVNHTQFTTLAPSGPSQVMLYKLLEESWGHEGFISWLSYLSRQYRERRDILLTACEHFLPPKVCHWSVPDVGMFVWIRIDLTAHPGLIGDCPSASTIEERIHVAAKTAGVQVCKGSWFATEQAPSGPHVFIRLTYAAVAGDTLTGGIKCFGHVLRDEFDLHKSA